MAIFGSTIGFKNVVAEPVITGNNKPNIEVVTDSPKHFLVRIASQNGMSEGLKAESQGSVESFEDSLGNVTLIVKHQKMKFELKIDREKGHVSLNSNGSVLNSKNRAFLKEMTLSLPSFWSGTNTYQPGLVNAEASPVHAVTAMVAWFAQAPLYTKINNAEFNVQLRPRDDDPDGGGGGGGGGGGNFQGCGENGVHVINSSCCLASGGDQNALSCHDAWGHGALVESGSCGNTNRCDGACGAYCNTRPVYTQDCLNHDRCVFHRAGHIIQTGPQDKGPDCGNEWDMATDDWILINIAPSLDIVSNIWVQANMCPDNIWQ